MILLSIAYLSFNYYYSCTVAASRSNLCRHFIFSPCSKYAHIIPKNTISLEGKVLQTSFLLLLLLLILLLLFLTRRHVDAVAIRVGERKDAEVRIRFGNLLQPFIAGSAGLQWVQVFARRMQHDSPFTVVAFVRAGRALRKEGYSAQWCIGRCGGCLVFARQTMAASAGRYRRDPSRVVCCRRYSTRGIGRSFRFNGRFSG